MCLSVAFQSILNTEKVSVIGASKVPCESAD